MKKLPILLSMLVLFGLFLLWSLNAALVDSELWALKLAHSFKIFDEGFLYKPLFYLLLKTIDLAADTQTEFILLARAMAATFAFLSCVLCWKLISLLRSELNTGDFVFFYLGLLSHTFIIPELAVIRSDVFGAPFLLLSMITYLRSRRIGVVTSVWALTAILFTPKFLWVYALGLILLQWRSSSLVVSRARWSIGLGFVLILFFGFYKDLSVDFFKLFEVTSFGYSYFSFQSWGLFGHFLWENLHWVLVSIVLCFHGKVFWSLGLIFIFLSYPDKMPWWLALLALFSLILASLSFSRLPTWTRRFVWILAALNSVIVLRMSWNIKQESLLDRQLMSIAQLSDYFSQTKVRLYYDVTGILPRYPGINWYYTSRTELNIPEFIKTLEYSNPDIILASSRLSLFREELISTLGNRYVEVGPGILSRVYMLSLEELPKTRLGASDYLIDIRDILAILRKESGYAEELLGMPMYLMQRRDFIHVALNSSEVKLWVNGKTEELLQGSSFGTLIDKGARIKISNNVSSNFYVLIRPVFFVGHSGTLADLFNSDLLHRKRYLRAITGGTL